jgi:hypothetical protein
MKLSSSSKLMFNSSFWQLSKLSSHNTPRSKSLFLADFAQPANGQFPRSQH